MEKKFSKNPLAVTLAAACFGLLGASPLVLADEGSATAPAEPAPATEPAADAAATPPAAEGAATEEKKTEEAAPAPAESGVAPGM